jgi:haloalkane dehalogenase
MKILRTPDERFVGLPGYPYTPRYATIDDLDGGTLRVHYLDEGRADAPVVVLMHGEPTWSYLYRAMVSVLVGAGYRCVVPDLVGFGRSDKPTRPEDYTYARHVAWMSELLFDRLQLSDITLFGQDWGALVGLRLVGARPHRFARVAIGNGGLPIGDRRPTDAFLAWQHFAATSPGFVIGRIVRGGCVRPMPDEVMAAYDAPFPDESYTAGARVFPSLVPTSLDDPASLDNAEAWETLRRFHKPFLCAFSGSDAITKGGERIFLRDVPGCAGPAHTTIEQAGHFLQEDAGPSLARVLVDFIGNHP